MDLMELYLNWELHGQIAPGIHGLLYFLPIYFGRNLNMDIPNLKHDLAPLILDK